MPYTIGSVQVIQTPLEPPEKDHHYDNGEPSVTVLRKGYTKDPDSAPFLVDTIFEKDVAFTLRDGVKIRADILRPADESITVPALVAWSPYGKGGRGFFRLDLIQGRVGIPNDRLSNLEKFEAPDPAEWTARGYAIVNVDNRGSWDSEGDLVWWGSQEGRDGYDVIEQVATSKWCNENVSLVGNSWLGIVQWFIAAERPPHLRCIAPFEGCSDLYREMVCRGGVPCKSFLRFLADQNVGRGTQEHLVEMIENYPRMNEYWEDKRAKVERINIPIYALASYSSALHTFGSFRGFSEAPVSKKWLRVHATQEWHDLYQKSTNDDLQKFLDHYLKSIDNGWEKTPKVRVSLLQYNEEPIVNHVFPDWPVPSTKYETLYLNANGTLSKEPPTSESVLSYQSDAPYMQVDDDPGELKFQFEFKEKTYLLGNARATFYASCNDHDDMDVWVQLRKVDRNGKLLQQVNIPSKDSGLADEEVERSNPLVYLGPTGVLRASHRAIDPEASTPTFPEHDYAHEDKVPPGTVVELQIGLWQTGIAFKAGERLMLKVSGHNMVLAEFPPIRGKESLENKGMHNLHMGASRPSSISIPLVSL